MRNLIPFLLTFFALSLAQAQDDGETPGPLPPTLTVTAGLGLIFDDLAVAQTIQTGSSVKYAVTVNVQNAPADNVVVWLPTPTLAGGGNELFSSSITNGGIYTATGLVVDGATVPANSVYWNLGNLPGGTYPNELSVFFTIQTQPPQGSIYTSTAEGRINGGSAAQSAATTLTIGNPNLPPDNGTVAVAAIQAGNAVQVTLTCSDWTDPEGNTPLSYSAARLMDGVGREVLLPYTSNPVLQFSVTSATGATIPIAVRIKDSQGHVRESLVYIDLPDIVVEQPIGTGIADGGSRNLGSVATGGLGTATFAIKNSGVTALGGFEFTLNGADAAAFKVVPFDDPLYTYINPGEERTFSVRFLPTLKRAYTAALHITTNDPDESPFDITLTGTGVTPGTLPTAKTVAATPIGPTSGTLKGMVNAKGTAREIWFDYGPTASLGSTVAATPGSLSTSTDETVSAPLTGLLPHTKYHYRVRAAGTTGGAQGATMTFQTTNRPPEVVLDVIYVVPGSTVTLDVLANDMANDPDGDTLSIHSFTQPVLSGKVTKVNDKLVFASDADFSFGSFTYIAKDAFGGQGETTVSLMQSTCAIDPWSREISYPAISYPVTVTVTDSLVNTSTGQWSVSESLPWVTVTPMSGTGNGTVTITVQSNAVKLPRSGIIKIGDKEHEIAQSGVPKPILTQPAMIPAAIVGGPFSLTIPTQNLPVTYTVTKMPPGLTLNGTTGVLSGTPTKGGAYNMTVQAKNIGGSADTTLSFDINVMDLKPGVIGAFHGLVDPHETLNANMGSRLELTPTSTGSYTGKLITGATSVTLKGTLSADPLLPNQARCLLSIPRKNTTSLTLDVILSHASHSLLGTLSDGVAATTPVRGWRNTWTTTNRATTFGGLYTFSLEQSNTHTDLPQGHGFGSFKLSSETTGAVTVAGKLADGNAFTCGTFVGSNGQLLVYQSLYGNAGSLSGALSIQLASPATNNMVGEELQWFKPDPLPTSKETLYKAGFGPLTLDVEGGLLPALAAGAVVMNLPNNDNNAQLEFSDGGLTTGITQIFSIRNPSLTGKTNKVTIPTNANKVTMPTLNLATGAIGGAFTLAGATTAQNRTVSYLGQIVKRADGIRGYGYFILPASTAASAIKKSGSVLLQAKQP